MQYKIEVFCDNDLNANTYLIYNETSCFIIDPANSVNTLSKYIADKTVLGIFLTHGHYDHFRSLKELLEKYQTKVYMHKNAFSKLSNTKTSYSLMFGCYAPTNISSDSVVFVKDNDKIVLDDFTIKCWYTPGHTDCMMSYILDENLFSGDFVFKGSIGRCDLETSDKSKMFNSVTQLKNRKTNFTIYPGHDDQTTLDDEKHNNIYLDDNNIRLVFE